MTPDPLGRIGSDDPLLHQFRNHLSVIVGFCDLLLDELPEGDARRADLLEMSKASHEAVALLPALRERLR
ncbi:MAG: hypothetical protein HY824_07610 [Acidobacteria bacterium]|nr:hypothetical protein [Acidobacteriota bacterium]